MNARSVVRSGGAGLILLVLAAGCGGSSDGLAEDDDSSNGASSAWRSAPATGGASAPTRAAPLDTSGPLGDDVDCPTGLFTTPVGVPAEFVGSLVACSTVAGGALLLKNESPLMLDVQSSSTTTTLRPPVGAGDDLRSVVALQMVTTTSRTSVRVPPGGYVVADGQPAQVDVDVDLDAAAEAYTVDLLSRYLESRLATPSQALTGSAAACASRAADLWQSTAGSQTDLDLLMAQTLLGPVYECRKFYGEVASQAGREAPRTEGALASELRGLGKDVNASVWDDVVGLVRRAAPVVAHA